MLALSIRNVRLRLEARKKSNLASRMCGYRKALRRWLGPVAKEAMKLDFLSSKPVAA